MASGPLRAYIELRGYGVRGPRYQVRMNRPDGMIIITATTEPLFDAARVLLAKGITGKLQLWDAERPFPRMRGDIAKLACLTVREEKATFERWRPFAGGRSPQKTAKRDPEVLRYPENELAAGGTLCVVRRQ